MFLPERWRAEKRIENEVLKMYSEIPKSDISVIKFKYYNLMRTLKRYNITTIYLYSILVSVLHFIL